MKNFVEAFSHLSSDQWLQVLKQSAQHPEVDGVTFPRFPEEDIQLGFNGSCGEAAMTSAHALWVYAEGYARALGYPLDRTSKVLDVGSGWGRITRTFLKDVPVSQIYGVDIDPGAIDLCRSLGVPGVFHRTEPGKPLPFSDNYFTVISAYSVFTHTPESVATSLIAELSRVLIPGGIIVMTVEDESLLDIIATPGSEEWGPRWALMSRYRHQLPEFRSRVAAGEYLYIITNESGVRSSDVYGDCIIPKAWMEKHWGKYAEVVRFEPTSAPINQAVVVLRKVR